MQTNTNMGVTSY